MTVVTDLIRQKKKNANRPPGTEADGGWDNLELSGALPEGATDAGE
jgi:hypothetical protein